MSAWWGFRGNKKGNSGLYVRRFLPRCKEEQYLQLSMKR